jgi:diguanylate cyclase (GGDEF)-like protein
MRRSGAPRDEMRATASASHASQNGPLDPRKVLTSIGEVVYDWDLSTDALAWGANAAEVLAGAEPARLASGAAFALMVDPGSGETRHEAILRTEAKDQGAGVPYRARYVLRIKGGRVSAIDDTGRWYAGVDGRPARAHGVLRIDRGEPADDALGLCSGDRAEFLRRLRGEVIEAGRTRRPLTMLVVAIDERLDDLGFDAADAVVEEVASRIRGVMRRRDALVRYAGSRFALALRSCPPDQAEIAAARLRQVIAEPPIATPLGPLGVALRIGGATAPDHAVDPATLLARAEEALAAAKRTLSRPIVMYDPASARSVPRAADAPVFDAVEALNARRILFAAQPVVEAGSRGVAFREALLRVRASDGTIVNAGAIMPAIERSGLVPLFDARMLELVGDHLAAHPEDRVAINVSPMTLETPDWLDTFAAHLGARPGIAPRLIVEVTETAAVRDPAATRARLNAMKALGVAIAIDDFGAGHTSFKHLRGFPVDLLKIDGAFVQNLARSPDDRFFVRALIDLAHHLGVATVAEWVEDEAAARMLADWGVDFLQGWHCGVPVIMADAAVAVAAEKDAA